MTHRSIAPSILGKPQYLLIGLLAAAAAASLPLIPNGRELALLRLESGRADEAITLLDRSLASGDRSPSTVGTLARIHVDRGDVDRALPLLRMLAQERPRDVTALRALADLSRDAAGTADYLAVLERLQGLAPTAERQREIARLYGNVGAEAKQRAALQALVDRFGGGTAADQFALAALLAATGDPQGAARALERLADREPAAIDAQAVGMEVSTLLAAGDADRALARANGWLRAHPAEAVQTALMLAGLLDADGRRDLAQSLLETQAATHVDPRLVTALAQIDSDSGHPVDALRRLERAETAGVASDELLRLHARLALQAGEIDRAMSITDRIERGQVSADMEASLASAALAAGRKDLLRRMVQRAGGRLLPTEPALAARTHLALGERTAARRRIDEAASLADSDAARLLELAELDLQLGRQTLARSLLRRAAAQPNAAPSSLAQMARLYIRIGYAGEGHAVLTRIRQQTPSLLADEAWALTAAASGQDEQVGRWLAAGGSHALPVAFHTDLFHLAMDNRSYRLAIAAAQRLYALRGSDADRRLLANALVAADQASEAIPHLRALSRNGLVDKDTYAAVLLAAWRQGEPAAEELRGIWSQRLVAAREPAGREAAVAALFELGAYAELLPTLGMLVVENPERWLGLYTDAAMRAGRHPELVALWIKLGDRAETPAALRQQIASRLLEASERTAAERILRDLATNAPHHAPAVRQLLHLWGPRPTARQLDWIEARARQSVGEEKAKWMRDLNERNGAVRTVAVHRAANGVAASDAYLDALVSVGDQAGFASALRATLAHDPLPVRPRRLVELAVQVDDPALQRQAMQRVASVEIDDAKTQRALGLLAYRLQDFPLAERRLEAYVAATGGDYESHLHLGEIRLRQRDAAQARGHFERALAGIEASDDPSTRTRAAQARVLQRLGRDAQALQLYESLLAERPQDKNLRADYVSLLTRSGTLRQARAVLDEQ